MRKRFMPKEIKYIIKNVETNEYFVGWEYAKDAKGNYLRRKGISNGSWGDHVTVKNPFFSKSQMPKLYNSHGGARKIISEFAGVSFAKNDKLTSTEKVLYGNAQLTKYEIVPVKVKLVEVKDVNIKQK